MSCGKKTLKSAGWCVNSIQGNNIGLYCIGFIHIWRSNHRKKHKIKNCTIFSSLFVIDPQSHKKVMTNLAFQINQQNSYN